VEDRSVPVCQADVNHLPFGVVRSGHHRHALAPKTIEPHGGDAPRRRPEGRSDNRSGVLFWGNVGDWSPLQAHASASLSRR
jgi:hypothetical protein